MREIKFKAKRKDNSEWVYGDLVHNRYIEDDRVFIQRYQKYITSDFYDDDMVEVIPETVSQFTSLKDKNGIEIYENDIIQVFNTIGEISEKLKIKWDSDMGTYEVLTLNDCHYSYDTKCAIIGCEVIGNIYDKEVENEK